MAKCFIAMPITTPEFYAQQLNDTEHFIHVLNYLFIPAVKAAGMEPVSPISSGSALIHAQIIKNIEECELMLCDVSGLNPNVFFELGVRTSLDKPVAIVRDSLTPKLPFDTSSINTHTYGVPLRPWSMKPEIDNLAEHIKITDAQSEGRNALWKIFGLTQRAKPAPAGDHPVEAKLDLIIDALSQLSKTSATPPGITYTSSAYQIPLAYGDPAYATTVAGNTMVYNMTNPGSIWATSIPTSDPNLTSIEYASEKYRKFAEDAKSLAILVGSRLTIEGYDQAHGKVIMSGKDVPWETTKKIAALGQKGDVPYELRG